jgi:ribonuclease VapC
MIVDASAVLAILMAEPDAEQFAGALMHSGQRAMSAVNWLEAALAVDRRGGAAARNQFETFFGRSGIEIVPVTRELALLARKAFDDWGKRRHRASLNMGDCIAYALARQRGEPLLFKGNDFSQTDIEPALKD